MDPQPAKRPKLQSVTENVEHRDDDTLMGSVEKLIETYEPKCQESPHLKFLISELREIVGLNLNEGEIDVKSEQKDRIKISNPETQIETAQGSSSISNSSVEDENQNQLAEDSKSVTSSFTSSTSSEEIILQVFSDNKILTKMFSTVDLKSLKKFRLVNKQWNEVVCKLLEQETRMVIKLNKVFGARAPNLFSVEEFIKSIGSNGQVPGSSFGVDLYLRGVSNRENMLHLIQDQINQTDAISQPVLELPPEYQNENDLTIANVNLKLLLFLTRFGNSIKHFDMSCYYYRNSNTITNLFLKHMPNIESLVLEVTPSEEEQLVNDSYNIQTTTFTNLPKLKHIKFKKHQFFQAPHFPTILLEAVLKAAPNLKTFHNFSLWMTESFIRAEKIGLVKECNSNCYCLSTLASDAINPLVRFAQMKPQLVKFKISSFSFDSNELLPSNQAISSILQSSLETLKILKMPCFENLQGVRFPPVFPNLEYLRFKEFPVTKNDDSFLNMFPFSKSDDDNKPFPFPKVSKVGLKMRNLMLSTLIPICEGDPKDIDVKETFPMVRTLVLDMNQKGMDRGATTFLAKKFPNLSKIIIRRIRSMKYNKSSNLDMDLNLFSEKVEFVELQEFRLILKSVKVGNARSWLSVPTFV